MEALVGGGFLDGVEIFALEVFHEGELQNVSVRGFTDDDRDFGKAELARSAPAAFASDEFVGIADDADDEWLDDAPLADALDEFLQLFARELLAWLEGAGNNAVEGEVLDALSKVLLRGGIGDAFVDECAEALAECLLCHGRGV